MDIETITMMVALVLLLLTVVAKVTTVNLLKKMQFQISEVNHEKQKILNVLRIEQARKEVVEKNKTELKMKKRKLVKKNKGLQNELKAFEEGKRVYGFILKRKNIGTILIAIAKFIIFYWKKI